MSLRQNVNKYIDYQSIISMSHFKQIIKNTNRFSIADFLISEKILSVFDYGNCLEITTPDSEIENLDFDNFLQRWLNGLGV